MIQNVPFMGDWHQNWFDLGGFARAVGVGYNQDRSRTLFGMGGDDNQVHLFGAGSPGLTW
jgi:hypothetical protein